MDILAGTEGYSATSGVQNKMQVRFSKKMVRSRVKSDEAGRDIFEEQDWVWIPIPGSRDVYEGPVRDKDKRNFAAVWQAFQVGQTESVEGTPLREWQGIPRTQAEELVHMGVVTVEQLAAAHDSILQRFGMGARALQKKAKAYLSDAKDLAPFTKIEAEKTKLEMENKRMQALIDSMSGRLEVLEDKPSPRPRRKSKPAEAEDVT